MTTVARPIALPKTGESVSTRLIEFTAKTPIHLALVLISVIWLVPTVGLFVTSLRAPNDILTSGWWLAFVNWRFTPENYLRVLSPTSRGETLWPNFLNSLIITIPSTILPVFIGAMAAYAFAWLSFRWRDTIFIIIVGLLIIPLQMTFVPILQLYVDALGPFKGLAGLAGIDLALPKIGIVLFLHRLVAGAHGLWSAVRDLPAALVLRRAAARPVRGCQDRRQH